MTAPKLNGRANAAIVIAVLTIMSSVLLREWYQVQAHETKIAVIETDLKYIRQSQDRVEQLIRDHMQRTGE